LDTNQPRRLRCCCCCCCCCCTVCTASIDVIFHCYSAQNRGMPYLTPVVALTLLLAKKVTRSYFHLGGPQTAAILGHKVAAPQCQLMCADDATPQEVGRDKIVYQRKLHQKELHLKCKKKYLWNSKQILRFEVLMAVNINKVTILWNVMPCSLIGSFFSFSEWRETESTWYVGHCWPIVPAPDDRWWWLWSSWWNQDWQGKPKYSEKTYPSATLSTTNPTWPDLGSNLDRHGGKPATNRLSSGTA
jgi:hypothetical protein